MAARRSSHFSYSPAVDGLRAVAVAAVVAFHLSPDAVPGGFLGVDTFFVVSGYLITSLLLAEHAADGAIRLRSFWARRARRLLPALLFVLCAVALGVALWWPAEDLARIRSDALGGLGYVANWRFIASGDSYFDLATGPSPLRHLWSLAIEEQFYVVWPLVTMLCLRRSPRVLGAVCAVGAVASVVAMVVIGAGDRAYYGTDTRASALLIGALLAVVLRNAGTGAPRWLAPAGAAAFVVCAAAWWVADESATWLFTFGFPAYALLTAVTVTSVVRRPASPLTRALASPPLVAAGKVSYGLYLWHWPVIVLLTESRTGLDGVALGAFRLAVTVAGTLVSYWLIERPVRFGAAIRGRVAAAATGAAFTGTAVAIVLATAGAVAVPDYLQTPEDDGQIVAAVSVNEPVVAEVPSTTAAPREPRRATSVALVGDSVAWTFQDELGAVLGARGVPFASAAVVGCGAAVGMTPGLGVPADESGSPVPWGYTCRRTTADLQDQALAAVDPDVVLFFSTWETSDRVVGDRRIRFGTEAWDDQLRQELANAVERLSAGGARVAFMTVPPVVEAELEPDLEPDDDRLDRYNRALRALAREDDRVLLIDFATLVCGGPTASCPTEVDGIRLRPLDGRHFEDEGAAWVAVHLADEVLALDLG